MATINLSKPILVQIMNSTTVVAQYTFLPNITCNGNETNYLKYINRYGVWDYLYFQGRKDSNLSAEYETYKYNDGNLLSGSYHKFIGQGRIQVALNTGWVDEVYNPMFEDLILSEFVLLNGTDPVIITDREFKLKTARFDRMINYTLIVEKAYDEINNVI